MTKTKILKSSIAVVLMLSDLKSTEITARMSIVLVLTPARGTRLPLALLAPNLPVQIR